MKLPDRKIAFFTLIEVVVAMGVTLVVAAIVGSASVMFYRGYDRVQRSADRLSERLAIDRVWDNCVRNAIPFQWRDTEDKLRFIFDGGQDYLLFATLRRAYGENPAAILFVRIERSDDDELVARYSRYPRPQWIDDGEEGYDFDREVLAKNIASISFQYAESVVTTDSDSEIEWYDEWIEEEHAAIPLAIRMRVEWRDGTVEYWLRRTAGISAGSEFGVRKVIDPSQEAAEDGTPGTTTMSQVRSETKGTK